MAMLVQDRAMGGGGSMRRPACHNVVPDYLVFDEQPTCSFFPRATARICAPVFQEDSECAGCGEAFSWARGRHHCRNCGSSLCGSCTAMWERLPHYGYYTPQRVCQGCVEELRRRSSVVKGELPDSPGPLSFTGEGGLLKKPRPRSNSSQSVRRVKFDFEQQAERRSQTFCGQMPPKNTSTTTTTTTTTTSGKDRMSWPARTRIVQKDPECDPEARKRSSSLIEAGALGSSWSPDNVLDVSGEVSTKPAADRKPPHTPREYRADGQTMDPKSQQHLHWNVLNTL